MCGLAGLVSASPSSEARTRVSNALQGLNHRGPDGVGISQSSARGFSVTLGHTRLQIIDLSSSSDQPMRSSSGRFEIVFNGEIYNYLEVRQALQKEGVTFQSTGDTEVLLAAWERWGLDCCERLEGMFGFAVFDHVKQVVWLVRDRYGIKPLYYNVSKSELLFAS